MIGLTDGYIIDLFLARSENAISLCDEKYGPGLRSFGTRITRDDGVAEECVNDTYLSAWNTIPPNEPRGYLFAFLSKILRNKCLDRIKSELREKRRADLTVLSTELSEAAPDSERSDSVAMKNELSELITKFLKSLPYEARQIFLLRYFYMEELLSISKRLSVSEGKVKTVLRRTREKLKAYLENYGYNT